MNTDIDYTIHYKNWHTPENKEEDIQNITFYLGENHHNFLPANKNDKILDLGCAYGRTLIALKRLGYNNLYGCELDTKCYEECKKEGLNIYHGDIIDFLNQDSNTYDLIYFNDVLEHIEKDKQILVLKLIKQHLSKNGKIMISVPNSACPIGFYYTMQDYTHNNAFCEISLSFILQNAGFKYFLFRPTHKDSKELINIKKKWYKMAKLELGSVSNILTPTIVAFCFNNEFDLIEYKRNSLNLTIDYKKITECKKRKILIKLLANLVPSKKLRKMIRLKFNI